MSNSADPVKSAVSGCIGEMEEGRSSSALTDLEVGIGGTEAKELVALLSHIKNDVSNEIDERFRIPEA